MSAAELAGWKAYYEEEPWGFEIEEIRQSLISYAVYLCSPGKKRNTVTPQKFCWSGTRQRKLSEPKDIMDMFKRITTQMNGTIEHG